MSGRGRPEGRPQTPAKKSSSSVNQTTVYWAVRPPAVIRPHLNGDGRDALGYVLDAFRAKECHAREALEGRFQFITCPVHGTYGGVRLEKLTRELVGLAVHDGCEHSTVLSAVGYSGDWDAPTSAPTTADPFGAEVEAPKLNTIKASDVVERRVAYAWERRIPIGSPTLMPGEEGIGKTVVGIRLMADITRGTLAGEYESTPRDVVIMAPEDGIEDVMRPRLREAGADLDRVTFVISRQTGEVEDAVIIPRDLPLLSELVRETEAVMVWVDALVAVLPDDLKSISYKDVNKAMTAIKNWCEAERVALVAPWHLNKSGGSDTALRMMDSRAFRTAVRSLLLVVEDPDAPEGSAQGIIALDKVNAGPRDVPALRYRIRSAPYVVLENGVEKDASCAVVDWIGPIAGDGRTIARAALMPKVDRAPTAKDWLRSYLDRNGPTERTTVIEAGEVAGHSKSAVTHVAATLPVHSEYETGRTNGVPWRKSYWSLPGWGPQIIQPPSTPVQLALPASLGRANE